MHEVDRPLDAYTLVVDLAALGEDGANPLN
jgi:hypothetical protein